MFNLKGAFSSCLTVVAFLVLAVLAARFYNGTGAQTNLDNSTAYQKGQSVLNTVWSYAKVIVGINVIKNVGVGNANLERNISAAVDNYSDTNLKSDSSGVLSNLGDRIKKELNLDNYSNTSTSDTASTGLNSYDIENNRPLIDLTKETVKNDAVTIGSSTVNKEVNDLKNADFKEEVDSLSSFINYRKTAEGAEIIIKSKSGAEYKFPLPFKFLAQ